jgi:hypothetical protein
VFTKILQPRSRSGLGSSQSGNLAGVMSSHPAICLDLPNLKYCTPSPRPPSLPAPPGAPPSHPQPCPHACGAPQPPPRPQYLQRCPAAVRPVSPVSPLSPVTGPWPRHFYYLNIDRPPSENKGDSHPISYIHDLSPSASPAIMYAPCPLIRPPAADLSSFFRVLF